MATFWFCGDFDAESCDRVETVAQRGIRESKSLGYGFWTKHDVTVAIATACATMATHWVCREFDAESCGSVKTVVSRGISFVHCLSIGPCFTHCHRFALDTLGKTSAIELHCCIILFFL